MTDAGRRPHGAARRRAHRGRAAYWWVGGLAIAALIVIVLAPLASADPDGLDSRRRASTGSSTPRRTGLPRSSRTTPSRASTGPSRRSSPAWSGSPSSSARGHASGALLARRRGQDRAGDLDLDRYVARDSPLHRADARLKFVLTVGFILAISLLPIGAFLALGDRLAGPRRSSSASAGLGPVATARERVRRAAVPAGRAAAGLHPAGRSARRPLTVGPLDAHDQRRGSADVRDDRRSRAGSASRPRCCSRSRRRSTTSSTALRHLRLPRIMVAIIGFMYRYLARARGRGEPLMRARAEPLGRRIRARWRRIDPLAGHGHRRDGRLAVPALLRAQRADLRGDAGARLRGRVPPPRTGAPAPAARAGRLRRSWPSRRGLRDRCRSAATPMRPARTLTARRTSTLTTPRARHARPRHAHAGGDAGADGHARPSRRRRAGSRSSISTSPTRTGSRRSAAIDLRDRPGREGRPRRSERRRQEHADAPPQRDPPARPTGRCASAARSSTGRRVKRIRAEVGLVFQDPDDQLFSPTVFDDVAFGPLHMGVARGRDPRPRRARPGRRRHERLRAAAAPPAVARPAQARGPGDRPVDGPVDPRLRRAVGRPRPARPPGAHRACSARCPRRCSSRTHDMRLVAEVFPRTVVMDDGRIVADGPTDRDPGRRRAPGGARARARRNPGAAPGRFAPPARRRQGAAVAAGVGLGGILSF